MKIFFITIISSLFLFTSCGIAKKSSRSSSSYKTTRTSSSNKTNSIVLEAKSYIGTRYRTGGTTKKGMDCSGLVYTSFNNNGVKLHRTSYDMSKQGKPIKTKEIKKGDLVFFKTSKSSRSVNHVGVVSKVNRGIVYFIHSSSSRGVIESNLQTAYWNKSFKFAKRVF